MQARLFRCPGCKDAKSLSSKVSFTCKRHHSMHICNYCNNNKLFNCPDCQSQLTDDSKVSNLDCAYCGSRTGTVLLDCSAHKICRDCTNKQQNYQCRLCNTSKEKCSRCKAVEAKHKLPCGKHMVCTNCRNNSNNECLACPKPSQSSYAQSCSMCSNRGCDQSFSVYKCDHKVCKPCLNSILKSPNTTKNCLKCTQALDNAKLEQFRRPQSVVEICNSCGKLKGNCLCNSVRPRPSEVQQPPANQSRISKQPEPKEDYSRLSSTMSSSKAEQLDNDNSKCCQLCRMVIAGRLIEKMCKHCYYEYRMKD